jgi:hypothetical protein
LSAATKLLVLALLLMAEVVLNQLVNFDPVAPTTIQRLPGGPRNIMKNTEAGELG